MSGSLTIVLLLKDRIEFTKRWMSYMDSNKCPYKIIIADGGRDQSIEQHLNNQDNYHNLNYEYIRYPYDEVLEDFYSKYHNVMNRVNSDYVIQADNDDFFILDRIPELIKFLDSNDDYVGVRGGHVDFKVYDKLHNQLNIIAGTHYTAIQRLSPSIDMSDPITRINYLCNNIAKYDYYSNWYCLFRTKTVCEIWDSLINISIKEPIIIEMLMHIFILEKGKIMIKDFPYYLRQTGTSQYGDHLITENDFLKRCINKGALSEFKTTVDQYLVDYSREDKKEIFNSLANWLQEFIVNINSNNLRYKNSMIYRLSLKIRSKFIIGKFIELIYIYFNNLTSDSVRRKVVELKEVENYIIK